MIVSVYHNWHCDLALMKLIHFCSIELKMTLAFKIQRGTATPAFHLDNTTVNIV